MKILHACRREVVKFPIAHGGSMDIFGMGSRHGLNDFEQIAIVFVLFAAFISLAYAGGCGRCAKKDKGTRRCRTECYRIGADLY
jgi:hypothetical protein